MVGLILEGSGESTEAFPEGRGCDHTCVFEPALEVLCEMAVLVVILKRQEKLRNGAPLITSSSEWELSGPWFQPLVVNMMS